MSANEPPQLPVFAEATIRFLAGSEFAEAVLGDLQEDLARQPRPSVSVWVWKQILAAAPGLFGMRLRAADFGGRLPVLLISLAMFAFLYLWAAFVTIPIMVGLRDNFGIGPSTGYLYFYLLVRLPSVAIAGLVLSYLTFNRKRSLIRNAATRLSLLFFLIALPQVWFLSQSGIADQWISGIARLLADAMALLAAGRLGIWFRQRNT